MSTSPLALPHSAVLAWWLTAWLRGHEQTDHVLDVLGRDTHLLEGGSALDLLALARASRGDVRRTRAAGRGRSARPGRAARLQRRRDGRGSGGRGGQPRAGARGAGRDRAVAGRSTPHRRQLPDVGEADRTLRESLLGAADDLADLEVARWRPEAADALMNLHHRPHGRGAARHPAAVRRPGRPRAAGVGHRRPGARRRRRGAVVVRGGASSRRAAAAGSGGTPRARRGVLARGVAGALRGVSRRTGRCRRARPAAAAGSRRRRPRSSGWGRTGCRAWSRRRTRR